MDRQAPLPSRIDALALADSVAVASQRAGATPDGSRLATLAGDLRVRMWRADQTAADAREAIELYSAAAGAARGTEAACEAERKRALLAGELVRDAGVLYRELYLVARRYEGALGGGAAPAPEGSAVPVAPSNAARSACLTAIDEALARDAAFRPSAEALAALARDAASSTAPAPPPPALSASDAALAVLAPSGSAAAGAPPIPPGGDVVVSPPEDAVGKDPVKVLGIEPLGTEDSARVVLRLSGPATFQVGVLGADDSAGKNPRVYVDLARATSKGISHTTEVGGIVKRVRAAAHAGGTRVVLDLAQTAFRRVFYLPDPFRVVIDVSTRPPAAVAAAAAERKEDGGPRNVRRIVVDPGHGGNDSGAIGPTGLKEKDVTLDIAHRLAPLLAHELQVETLLTRDDDTYVPLDLRAARANAFHADLFVSIHCNAAENTAARGVQTFILDEARDADGFAARVAARENAQRGSAKAANIAAVMANLNIGGLSARSRHVADLLQRSTVASLMPRYPDTKDQGVKTAGFYVLVGAEMPAVLFETAFISNTDDEAHLGTADYRQKLADSIVNAVRAYKAGK